MLKTADEVVGKIGDPKPISAESKPEQQQQQQQNLQQNGSGPVQRNMSGRKSIFTISQEKQYYDKLDTQNIIKKQQVWFNLNNNNMHQPKATKKPHTKPSAK